MNMADDKLELVPCPLCNAESNKLIFKHKDYRFRISDKVFNVVKCRKCGLVYVNPRPTEDEIHSYYPEEFYDVDINAKQLLQEAELNLFLKYKYVKDLSPGKLLDIGCMKGEFMYFMKERGWEVQGLDFSSTPPNVFGLDIFYGDLEEAGYEPASFDLITLWAVLEHVYAPCEMLVKANRLLKPGGKLVLLVTNFNSIPARLLRHDDIPRHTILFTERTLHKMLRYCGYKVDKFYYDWELYGGSTRGILNYLFKLMKGEKLDDIVAQNRTPGRWHEFSNQIQGKDSPLMLKIDRLDIAMTPYLDKVMDYLRLGFLMIARATKERML
jgi:2-polyprenyl-3-methyl-5-hydroxy-6-metoxy-1,4-benzoquinol methylase